MRASLLFLMAVATAFAQKKPVTIQALEEIAALPSLQAPGNPLAWAPEGARFVYRQGATLRVYDMAAGTSRQLLDVSSLATQRPGPPRAPQPFEWQNRRVTETPVQWVGNTILYAAGGELFLIDPMTGASKKLPVSSVNDPKLSPDARMVAFRQDWDLYTLNLETNKRSRLTNNGDFLHRNGAPDWVYPEELDLGTAYWWSPDSKSIAYLRFDLSGEPLYPHADLRGERALAEAQRYPQAGERNPDVRLGVVGATGGNTKWFDTGNTVWETLVARVTWTPDAKQLYVISLNRRQSNLRLLAYDIATKKPKTILEESDLYWVNLNAEPQFLKDGAQFLWQSERDGFRHLYLYESNGTLVRQLTSGPWEVTAVEAVDEASGVVYYTSSEPSPLERHGYRMALDGSGKRQLTSGAGTHSMTFSADAKFFLHSYSSTAAPPRVTVDSAEGREIAVYREADRRVVDQYALQPVELGKFAGPGGVDLYYRLIRPSGFDPAKKYPAVVLVYGGPGAQGVRNSWSTADLDQVLANAGFAVWQVDNRGTSGRGHAFETPLFHNFGPTELADQIAGVQHLISMGFADPARIGIRGWSYGGFMTLNAMLNAPDTFKAGAAGAPVTDWRSYDTIYTERYMGLRETNPDGYKNTALPQKAANLKGSLMILHNYEDDNVLFQNTLHMIEALEKAGKQFDLVLYTQKTHGVSGAEAMHRDAAMLGFFERALK